ncbi:hypothetical protein EYF88_01795 [Paracoccus sediminis]|nr:hypothetical protein [Paracoccus sediminis]TBN52961.1 hypothetical protein EYF88_01795 [Paracoccus sediminis]
MTEQRACANDTLRPTTRDDKEHEFLTLMAEMDEVEKLIFHGAVKALAERQITLQQCLDRLTDHFERYRRGEAISLEELGLEGEAA